MLDSEFLESLKSKNAAAIGAVVEKHADVLLRAAFGLGFREGAAEDLVQETFVTFLEIVDRFEGRSSVRTFLFGILYRKAKERRRKSSHEVSVDPVDGIFDGRFGSGGMWTSPPRGPDEEALSNELGEMIRDCLAELPDKQKAAFHLREVERMPSEELRNVLDVNDTHLRVLLFRARNRLRECLEKRWSNRP